MLNISKNGFTVFVVCAVLGIALMASKGCVKTNDITTLREKKKCYLEVLAECASKLEALKAFFDSKAQVIAKIETPETEKTIPESEYEALEEKSLEARDLFSNYREEVLTDIDQILSYLRRKKGEKRTPLWWRKECVTCRTGLAYWHEKWEEDQDTDLWKFYERVRNKYIPDIIKINGELMKYLESHRIYLLPQATNSK